MTNKHLKPYAGSLSASEIAEGIGAAQANADRLIEDAKLLMDSARYPSAAALAILAIEERGKVTVLRHLALAGNERALREAWRDYRNHRAKNVGWIIPSLVADGARTMAQLGPALDKDAEHAFVLDALKQVAIYTDCLGDRHWSAPAEVIEPKLAETLIATAEAMWGSRAVTGREIELWMEIVAPEYGRPGMAAAVVEFQRVLHMEGLHPDRPESLQAFMEGRPLEVGGKED